MKKLFVAVIALAAVACGNKNADFKFTVSNPSDFDRLAELAEIPVAQFENKISLDESQGYVVKDSEGNVVVSQITADGLLLIQPELKAGESKTYTIVAGTPGIFGAKTYGRYVPERRDDWAWENDRVAFRIYGPALLPIDGPSNGIDVWFKRTSNLVLDKWYKNDIAKIASYHEDHGEGLDDYKVGRSLGAGAMAPYADGKLWLGQNYASQEAIDNGPLRTSFKLTYNDVEVDGKGYSETRNISIDAGSQLTKITQEFGFDQTIEVAAGLVKRENDDFIATDKYIVYEEPESKVVDNVYMALVFPEGIKKSLIDTYEIVGKNGKPAEYSHIIAVADYEPGRPVTYYTGFGWSKFGFPTVEDFVTYVENFSKALENPFVVKYE